MMKRILVETVSPYEVLISAGLIMEPQALIDALLKTKAHRFAMIADDHLIDLYAAPLIKTLARCGIEVHLIAYKATEKNKSRSAKAKIEDALLAEGFQRDVCLIALGGGITTDMAGFVAATYMRGVPVIYMPTTLLAMVDASVGGKTAVNTAAGKNLIGAFYQPSAVLIDPMVLKTLPFRAVCDGMAELIKHALLCDTALLNRLKKEVKSFKDLRLSFLTEVIARSIEIKRDFVVLDEKDKGLRQFLNLGHTLAHALEATSQFKLSHGQAVAMGLILEAKIAEHLRFARAGLAEDIHHLLKLYDLAKFNLKSFDPKALLAAMLHDKKNEQGDIRMVFIEDFGKRHGDTAVSVSADAILAVLKS